MKLSAKITRSFLALSLVGTLVVCQVPGRLFFLSRIWQGRPSANLSPNPESSFTLQAIQPALNRTPVDVGRASDAGTALALPVDGTSFALPRPTRFRPFFKPHLLPCLLFGRPTGRSPPL